MVVDLLVKMGYGGSITDAGKAIGKSGDEGIDGTIKKTSWVWISYTFKQNGGRRAVVSDEPEIQKFVGALAGQGCEEGNIHYNFVIHQRRIGLCAEKRN